MAQITKVLGQGLNIELNKILKSIDSSSAHVQLQLSNCITCVPPCNEYAYQERIQVDHTVVTVPLGVLKSKTIKFYPQLPPEKRYSMMKLGCSLLEKFTIKFDHVFWNKNCDWFNYISEESYEWTQTFNNYKVTKEPILTMFNSERSSLRFAKLTD